MIAGQCIDCIFFDGLEIWFFIEQKKDGAIYSVEIRVHKHFCDCDAIKLFLSFVG